MYLNIDDEEVPVILWLLVISGLQSAHAEAAEQIYLRGGGAGVRGCKTADYPRKASVSEGQELGGRGFPPPPQFHHPCAHASPVLIKLQVIKLHNGKAWEQATSP